MERILECVMNGFVLIILSVISMLLLHMKVQMELPDMRKRYQFMNRLGMNRRERHREKGNQPVCDDPICYCRYSYGTVFWNCIWTQGLSSE